MAKRKPALDRYLPVPRTKSQAFGSLRGSCPPLNSVKLLARVIFMNIRLPLLRSATLGCTLLSLVACGGGNNLDPDQVLGELAGTDQRGSAALQLQAGETPPGATILSDPVSFDPFEVFPVIVELQRHADSGLLVGFTHTDQIGNPSLDYVNDAWMLMQSCLGITADAPLIILQQDSIEPLASTDDIVLDFQGRISASANDGGSGASLQVMASEVAASYADRGFSLRSIMGRYLWRNNGLPERDYRYTCAKTAE